MPKPRTARAVSPARAAKDQEEAELEKLVFGDSAGFHDGLKNLQFYESSDSEDEHDGGLIIDDEAEKKGKEVALLGDEQLFFVDEGSDVEMEGMEVEKVAAVESEEKKEAWVDSDDEKLTVSLKGEKRNRKLRDLEKEDVVSGKEYARRLRRQ